MTRFLHAYIQLSGLLLSLSTGLEARSTNAPIVDLGYAQYAGVINPTTGNVEFLGMRYAAPPTGTVPPSPSPLFRRQVLRYRKFALARPTATSVNVGRSTC